MIDAKALLDRFLGPGGTGAVPGRPAQPPSPWGTPSAPATGTGGGLADLAKQVLGSGGGFVGGTAAGGLLGVLLGKKTGKRTKGLLSHGGAAVLGALAHRAWQNWQAGQAPGTAAPATARDVETLEPRFLPATTQAAGGEPFELSLIRAMIGAARADGHIDAEERARIFEQVEKAGLDAEAKAFVFDTLDAPIGVSEVAAAARTPEQAAELYLISRLAVNPDELSERAYLQALAHRLKLPDALVAHLDRQADAASRPAT
ncbi:tellurite resistance TerB family protein [Rhodovastum atsumiense]|uniref:Tellurite resistance TerB family protein n=1 Tax=Rhodovastum atsumiense TaxID=504468 RepID=A0A5M6IW82_9PROT|nr:DUF533 domain-containing protein [Rhodovastum atsumiense]KAA5612586.1 tellurite resistance TerB family protein [Rhodovastum atsumiense]